MVEGGGEEDGEVGENGSRGGATPKHSSQSGGATPRPDGGLTPRPRSMSDGSAQAQQDDEGSRHDGLKPLPMSSDSYSRTGSRAASRAASPAGDMNGDAPEEGEDTTMTEAMAEKGVVEEPMDGPAETPQVTISEPADMAVDEGAPEGVVVTEDTMDTT